MEPRSDTPKQPPSLPEEKVRHWVELAIRAPSGDNCQPWSFTWDGTELEVVHLEQRAKHVLNPHNTASLISLGAIVESLHLAASDDGFETSCDIMPRSQWEKHAAARLSFAPSASPLMPTLPGSKVSYQSQLEKRSTYRLPFAPLPD